MERIISVKEGKIVERDDKEWVELIDQEGKTHRIFPSMLGSDGVWVHLDKEIDILKPKIEDGSISGLALKLTKEKKGMYWNVIGVEEVKDVFQQKAIKETQDAEAQIRPRSYALAYAKDLAVAKVIGVGDILTHADLFNDWLTIGFKVEKPFAGGGAVVPSEIPPSPPKLTLNMDWLSESIKKIWPEIPNVHFAQFLIKTYGIEKAKSIDLMLKQLTQKQQADLCGKLTEMLEKI